MKAKKWILVKDFCGTPSEENLKLVDFDHRDKLEENEVLLQAVYLSVDPYMRVWGKKEGQVMIGEQLSEVIHSRNGKFPIGALVLSKAGWVTHFISKGDDLSPIRFDLGKTPISYTLGVLGMTGATAYFGLNKCEPKDGEVFVISCAAGAVGSVAGQLAKLKGLKVIGLVGSDEKVRVCKQEFGYDHVINYKKSNINEEIKKIAPDGVDIYFDNAGGTFYTSIIEHNMKNRGRVLVCGSIQTYCCVDRSKLEKDVSDVIKSKNLSCIDFRAYNYYNEWPKAFNELNKLIQDGKLKVKEQVYHGFEKMRDAFYGLFEGENIGKSVVKVVNQSTNYP
ncbi:unnamed protein product [Brachionus calyciflorus]|uniref:15-oxoprostaglandin 13-reductase n=1 Tax=Brachionus calyciflorus TaxID=104777 RepID=A0A813PG80_9BILA|nr:unnamed protein product [Brachionus calyciflorus]